LTSPPNDASSQAFAARKPTPRAVSLRIGAALAITNIPACADATNINTIA
jgi:hypothetical protein